MLHCYDESIEKNATVTWHKEAETSIQMLLRTRGVKYKDGLRIAA